MICVTSWAHRALYRVSKATSCFPASIYETPRIGLGRRGNAGPHEQRAVILFWAHRLDSEGAQSARRCTEIYRDTESAVNTTEAVPRSIHVQQ
jgi:hypothetical protein